MPFGHGATAQPETRFWRIARRIARKSMVLGRGTRSERIGRKSVVLARETRFWVVGRVSSHFSRCFAFWNCVLDRETHPCDVYLLEFVPW